MGGRGLSLSGTLRWERVRGGDGMKKTDVYQPSLHGSAGLVPAGGGPRPADKPRCRAPPIVLLTAALLLATVNESGKLIPPRCCFRTGRG